VSSEKNDMKLPDRGIQDDKWMPDQGSLGRDMDGYRAELLTIAQSGHGDLPPGLLAGVARRRISRANALDRPLRCVWSSHPSYDRCCRSRVPTDVVTEAWRGELERGRVSGGFFHFVWRGSVWLAYGLPDGLVRGVYCPSHRAEREERLGYDPELVPAAIEHAAH
jgi:hypothetical protein